MLSRTDAEALDTTDPLATLRSQFSLPPGVIYLDGNSLGALPVATGARLQQVVTREWGQSLIGGWNGHEGEVGWIELPRRVGDKIARLVGAGPGELIVADSTSVNLYKVLAAALALVQDAEAASGAVRRRTVLTEISNFPTDLYIAAALAADRGFDLKCVASEALTANLDEHAAVLLLTHVNYRNGRLHDMAALSAAAHAAGALAIWDLAHSAGAVPVELKRDGADFAIGCGYKYLNGGPGAPAFVWVDPRHASLARQPLAGWMGHAAPFAFTPDYIPAAGSARFLCGTPPVLSLAALECGIDTVLAAEAHGGMAALRRKSLVLTRLFAAKVQAECPALRVVSPEADAERGSQVCLSPATGFEACAWPVVQALIARGVVGDFRAGDASPGADPQDILRFGFTPLYLRHVDAWDAAEQLRQVLDSGQWRQPSFAQRQGVT
ncbi:MAG: kynureninase [Pseudomonadota bacterium]|nr:kynureninase [Pseudomonadota bacterium]